MHQQLTFDSVEGFLSVPEIVQVSTCQVPVGEHSIFDHLQRHLLSEAEALVYLKINECSHWESGSSHGLSYSRLSKDCGMSRSQVIAAVKGLVSKGWLSKNVRGNNLANTYQVVHHFCDPLDAPLDQDGLPKKCAMPRGAGSAFALLGAGRISWQACLYWHVCKMLSDWSNNFISLTIAQAREWLRFGQQTICDIRKIYRLPKKG
ncbi:helix-turn-helix domain-containing protein [Candidatus Poribacteria bacterium]|nr:helix-turn-helix domain-containing protein [Candidatus Poribacteria bacterium]MYK21928.1 helix-turn-helix domain-containing protein [Candidatus Poribacteria bacterium]